MTDRQHPGVYVTVDEALIKQGLTITGINRHRPALPLADDAVPVHSSQHDSAYSRK